MPTLNKDKVKILSSNLFPVVGVGASAGGLDAFKKLLKAIPEDSGMAYILVQHLDPAHESILADLLQKVTKIPVKEIIDNVEVEANHIYIIPSNKLLTATDGILQLSSRLPKNQKNLPIDVFFTSLAEVHQNHAIGVVLSGTASDGTLGLKAIKEHGGITFAQDQASAAYDAMPQSAIDAGVVDFILSPEKIPQQLILVHRSFDEIPDGESGTTSEKQEDQFKQIMSILYIRKSVDFTYYKQTTIRRRIARRIALSRKANMSDYLVFLKQSHEEQDILYQDLLIPVTQFFRDPKVFAQLEKTVFPALLNERPDNEPLRIWIAGCSTGEEAYSMAMCFQEYNKDKSTNVIIQLFATDISEIAIAKARSGVYSKNEIDGLSPARIKRFFTKINDQFRVNKNIRDSCVFAFHNYLKDPPFAKMDLISCRNSLIYLQPFLQKKALTTFHYALRKKGFLLLGQSETAAQAPDLYHTEDKANKLYTGKPVKGNFLHVLGDRNSVIAKTTTVPAGTKESSKNDFQKSGDALLLSKYAPAGVIVNEDLDIVQYRGSTGTWLEPSSGAPTLNILKMARQGIAFELRNALHKVKKNKTTVIKENVVMEFAGKERLVTLEVFFLPNTTDQYFLILFRDAAVEPEMENKPLRANKTGNVSTAKLNKEIARNLQLQNELVFAREDMRSVTEEQEAANEELQSANEELLSGSEELQSLNEELETSKEEVQTSNEELIVVNQELFDRNEQLNISRLFAESVVTTIREPLLTLTKGLKVKSANKSFYDKFQLSEDLTVGKLLFELGHNQWDIPGLRQMLEKMLEGNSNMTDFEVTHQFPALGKRTLLLNASLIATNHPEEQSILLAIEDITEQRKLEKEAKLFEESLENQIIDRTFALQEANDDLQLSNDNLEQFAYIASHDLQEPLRKIRTFSAMLQDKHHKDLSAPALELVARINSSSERMSLLIKEVLNFSGVLHGEIIFSKTDLDEILSKVLADLDLLIAEKKVTIYRKPLPFIDAIPFQISQLFFQLVSNAIKFSDKRKKTIISISSKLLGIKEELQYAHLNPKFSYCEISIKDNGIGFRQEFADQIFLVFKRLHNISKFSGSGIGLALCKTIASNHNGQIISISKENEGALFKIALPINRNFIRGKS